MPSLEPIHLYASIAGWIALVALAYFRANLFKRFYVTLLMIGVALLAYSLGYEDAIAEGDPGWRRFQGAGAEISTLFVLWLVVIFLCNWLSEARLEWRKPE